MDAPTWTSGAEPTAGRAAPVSARADRPRARTSDLSVLVAAAVDGDEQAFRALYRAVQPAILRYLRTLVGADAEDVASETWLQITRHLASFRGGDDDFRAWSATIARHRALDHLRAVRRRPYVSVPDETFVERPGPGNTAAEAIASLATERAVAMIASLPREQAEAVMLRVVFGLDAEAAGRVLGKRAGAVRTAAHRGLRRLAQLLEQTDR